LGEQILTTDLFCKRLLSAGQRGAARLRNAFPRHNVNLIVKTMVKGILLLLDGHVARSVIGISDVNQYSFAIGSSGDIETADCRDGQTDISC
jgi:hypothetical protein